MRAGRFLFLVPVVVAAQGLIRPSWIEVLPQQQGRIYAVGLAPFAPNQAQAVKQASQNARVEVVTRLRASVKGETNIKSSASFQRQLGGGTTGKSQQQIAQDSQITTQALELPGLGIEETWVDQSSRTAYALAFLDVAAAERELQSRLSSVRKDAALNVTPSDDLRERIRAIQRMRKGQEELKRIDALATTLIAGGLDESLPSDVHGLNTQIERKLDVLRPSIAVGLRGERLSGEDPTVPTLLRNAIASQGLSWVDAGGDYTIHVKLPEASRAQRWWNYQESPDFVVAVGIMDITLLDRGGRRCQAAVIEARGVGSTAFLADRALQKDCQTKLETTLGRWLEALAQ